MKKLIVVGVDGSRTATLAAQTAFNLAEATGATLHVLTAYGSDRTEALTSGADEWLLTNARQAAEIARTVADGLRDSDVPIEHFATRGKPGDAFINHAQQHHATLLVVGNKNMQGLGRVLGSVANTVVHNAPCDVYVVKTTHRE
jgi:nucleotide-binding universal stress UspA family protein